jgi:hypothetical protein
VFHGAGACHRYRAMPITVMLAKSFNISVAVNNDDNEIEDIFMITIMLSMVHILILQSMPIA